MQLSLLTDRVALGRRETLTIRDGKGVRLACIQGMLWITQDGDARDILIGAGESFVLDRQGVALVNAVRPSQLHLVQPGSLLAGALRVCVALAGAAGRRVGNAILNVPFAAWRRQVRY